MNNKSTKYFLSALLIITTLFSSLGTAFGATSAPPSDITAHWAQSEVTEWIEQGFINGYADGSFKPDNNIKRTEFIALINRSFGFTETATISYKDISSSNWAYTEVAKAVKAGYINGYSDGTIGVGKSISRQEAAVIINRLLKLDPAKNSASFSDSSTIAPWALDSVNAVVSAGIMKGYSQDNSFKPGKDITRAEAVVALTRTKAVEPNHSSLPGSSATGTPAATVSPTPTPIISPSPSPTPIYYAPSDPTATPNPGDTVAPILTDVTIGSVTVGENVYGTSNEDGFLYLVPSTAIHTKTGLEDSIKASLGKKMAVTAAVYSSLNTQGLPAEHYVLYAVDASDNISAASSSIEVKAIQLTIDIPTSLTETKMYDGTVTTAVTANTLAGVLRGDVVEVQASASYSSAALGINKTITVVYSLTGAHAASYIAPAPYTIHTGTIVLNQLTIETPDLTLAKKRDGTTTAAVTPGQLIGVAPGEDVSVSAVANYDTSAVGTNKTITVVYTLHGADAGNYIAPVNYTVTTGEIDRDQITRSKVYDGTTAAAITLGQVNGIIDGDDVTVHVFAAYTDAKVGTNKTIEVSYTLTGEDAGNYFPPPNYTVSTGTITALQLSITPPVITASKIYDGTTSVQVTAGQLIGVIPGDDVTVSATATYSDAAVGTNKIITVVYTLSGADAANYVAPTKYAISTGVITAP